MQDRVLLSTRIVAACIAPFLILAFAVLVPVPTDTQDLFAWAIQPTFSAMVLGSVYLGGAYFFIRVVWSRRWHAIAGGFVPVATFAGLMGVATLLHWDRFIHSNAAFWLWVALYFTTPFIVVATFVTNRRREYVPPRSDEIQVPALAAYAIVAGGVAALLMSAFLYLFPGRAISIWPWQLTPLTARMLGAIFALGIAGLGMARERRWSAARLLLQVAEFMIVLILVAAIRAHDEFDTARALTWLFAIGFTASAVAVPLFYLMMERRTRTLVGERGR